MGDPFGHALGGYFFTSLGQLLEHIFVSDMNWMGEFLAVADHGLDLAGELGKPPEQGKRAFGDFATYRAARERLDDFIVACMARLEDADLQKTVSRMTRQGIRLEREVWKALIHFFNHQTHHRGQVSDILDNLKIENNYSNMIFLE